MKLTFVRLIVSVMLSLSVIAATIPPPTITEKTPTVNCCKKWKNGKCVQWGTRPNAEKTASGSATIAVCR